MADDMEVDQPELIEYYQEMIGDEDDDVASEESRVYYTERITVSEYNRQADDFTQNELRKLRNSEAFKKWHQTCKSCKKNWFSGEFSLDCKECAGHAMQRNCPLCDGNCGAMFVRDVEMSHRFESAHWNGVCRLPTEHQQALILLKLSDLTDGDIMDAVADLRTSD